MGKAWGGDDDDDDDDDGDVGVFPPPFLETKIGSWYNLDISTRWNHSNATREVGDHRLLTLRSTVQWKDFVDFFQALESCP